MLNLNNTVVCVSSRKAYILSISMVVLICIGLYLHMHVSVASENEISAEVKLDGVTLNFTLDSTIYEKKQMEGLKTITIRVENINTQSLKQKYRVYIQVGYASEGHINPRILIGRSVDFTSSGTGPEPLEINVEMPNEPTKDGVLFVDVRHQFLIKRALIISVNDGGARFTKLNEYLGAIQGGPGPSI